MILTNIYNQSITLLNKSRGSDNGTKTDIWYKYVIKDAAWYDVSNTNMVSSSVFIGASYKILLPYHSEYMMYKDWKALTDKTKNYTLNIDDYIFLGEIPDTITATNIVAIVNLYKPKVCKIGSIKELPARGINSIQVQVEGS